MPDTLAPKAGSSPVPRPPALDVTLTINGEPRARRRALDDAARRAARAARPHRHQEGLRPRPVRRLHRAGRRPAHQLLPDPRGHARTAPRSRPSKAWPHGERCTRCRQAFIEHDAFQCGYCTPGQICSAVGLIERGPRADARRDPRADERQHLPLRRLPQHRRRDRAGACEPASESAHEPLRLRPRPTTWPTRCARRREPDGASSSPAAPTSLDLMKEDVERPDAADRHQPPAARTRSRSAATAACGSARW